MATLIPAIGYCSARMSSGEQRFARRLEAKLEGDYLCWFDVSLGEAIAHPDFVVFHPSHGLLVLEVKDWEIDMLCRIDEQQVRLHTELGFEYAVNPLERARKTMLAITAKFERDPQLVWPAGSLKGRPFFPHGHGVVLPNISRRQFDGADLGEIIPAGLAICGDEMDESVAPEEFRQRLWAMFPIKYTRRLSLPQIDRIRWHLFPDVRIPAQQDLFEPAAQKDRPFPDIVRVMDLQQEQLARSLSAGHQVIHGAAGSGKTMILAYRAQHLARHCRRPVLGLCYNKTLAARLAALMETKGLQDKVNVVHFHAWCVRQLETYNVAVPPRGNGKDAYFEACVERVIEAVDQNQIPAAQYDAVLIDEGHDFKPEWLKLLVQMIHPDSNALLVLYDDAQAMLKSGRDFSFSSAGVQAESRTAILRLNYRNTAEILMVARAFAQDLLSSGEQAQTALSATAPAASGRRGPTPLLVELPSLKEEIEFVTDRLLQARQDGMQWMQMAVLYRRFGVGQQIAEVLARKGIPCRWERGKKSVYSPRRDSVTRITMQNSKGLESPLVCIPALGRPGKDFVDEQEEARLLYLAMTRATEQLVMTHGWNSILAPRVHKDMDSLKNL